MFSKIDITSFLSTLYLIYEAHSYRRILCARTCSSFFRGECCGGASL